MSDAGLKVTVGANVQPFVAGMRQATEELQKAEKELVLLGSAIDRAIDSGVKDVSTLEDAYQALNNRIKELRQTAAQGIPNSPLQTVGRDLEAINPQVNQAKAGFAGLTSNTTQTRIAFIDLGRAVTGQGFSLRSLASNFALLGPGVTIAAAAIYGLVELFAKQTDQEKKAAAEAERLKQVLLNLKSASDITETSTGSEAGNIARVQALAAALQDTNKSYKERKNALDELRETNKAYFGDLTLEAASLSTLSARVHEYGQALITEAIIKGQVDEIAKISAEYEKQVRVLKTLKDARDRAENAQATTKITATGGGIGSVGGTNISQESQLASAVSRTEKEFKAQQTAVDQLSFALADYRSELDRTIDQQIKFKPLKDAPAQKDDLKSIIPILEQIKRIYDEIAKPNKEPLFKQLAEAFDKNDIRLIQAQIAEAIKKGATDGAKDPAIRQAYEDLATALRAKLSHLENPDLHTRIQGIVDVKADDVSAVESKIEKALGGSKGLEIKVPALVKLDIKNSSYSRTEQSILIKNAEEEALKGLPPVRWTPAIQVLVNKAIIEKQLAIQLGEALNKSLKTAFSSGFSNIGESIGKAIASGKGPIEAAGKSILVTLGTLIEDIGKNLIEYGIVKEGLDTVLQAGIALPGAAAIAIGIAAEAIGALVKNAGSSYKAFATGGIITGPTLGLIGEAGPEVVFPLNQLNRFVKSTQGNGVQNINVTGAISGNNIRLALARTSKLQGLV